MIISGIKPTNNDENDIQEARSVIKKLSIVNGSEPPKVIRIKKIVDKQWVNTSIFRVVLNSVITRDTALETIGKSNKIKSYLSGKKYYVNKDMTSSERITFNKLLTEKNDLNKKLKFVDNFGKRYDIEKKTNKHYFWVIRENELKKFYLKPELSQI